MEASVSEIPEVVDVGTDLEDLVGPIRHKLEQGQKRLEDLEEAAKLQRSNNARMKRALSVIDPSFEPPGVRPRKKRSAIGHIGVMRANGTATGYGISIEGSEAFVNEIRKQIKAGEKFVTQKGVYDAIDSDQAKASSAFKFLHAIGFLRRAGRDKETRRENWAIQNDKAYEDAVRAVTDPEEKE